MGVRLKSRSYIISKDKILCVPNGYAAVFELDIRSFTIRHICDLDSAFKSDNVIAFRHGETIFFLNLSNGAVSEFDERHGKNLCVKRTQAEGKFVNAFQKGDYIYLVPKVIEDSFLIYDIKKRIYMKNAQWNMECAQMGLSGFICNADMDNKGRIICTVRNSNIVFRYDREMQEISKFSVCDSDICFKCILVDSNKYYITPSNRHGFMIYDTEKNDYEEIVVGNNESGNYLREILIEDKLFLQTKSRVDVFDTITKRLAFSMELSNGFYGENTDSTLFYAGFCLDKKYYLLPYAANMMLEINQNSCFTGRLIEIDDIDIIHMHLKNAEEICESDVPLDSFLEFMTADNYNIINIDYQKSKPCGTVIYNELKNWI